LKPCVVIPAYDNAATLAEAVQGAREHLPVIVVDDGSTDGSAQILAGLDGITLERHARNRGKGVALRTGFDAARRAGFTHVVSVDADGQHPAAMIPRLLKESGDAIVIGARDLQAAGAGLGSRLGRANSNFWTWVETGRRLPDTQSGLRSYPLAALEPLRLVTRRYDFEIEVLVKAAWAGTATRSVPVDVTYAEGRTSHYRPVLDFLRIALLNVRLVLLRLCLPAPYLGLIVQRRFFAMPVRQRIKQSLVELFLNEPGSSRRIALSVGLGLFMGIAPIWGFQIAATLLAAHVTGLSKPVAVVASHISVPIFIPAILYLSLLLGRLAIGTYDAPIGSVDLEPADLPAFLVGSLILAAATSVVGGVLTYVLVRCARA
jgi:glycosyltransferase involved in cell wall biosynthesis